MKVVRLDELQRIELRGVGWRPLRAELGIRAFGVNVFEAEAAGGVVIHEHDETGRGAGRQRHEELYVVLAGEAEFSVDGVTASAPAGTAVFVADAAAHRSAVAREDGTRILAIGGPAGEAYEPGPWEAWFR